jgi:LysM repeat protein
MFVVHIFDILFTWRYNECNHKVSRNILDFLLLGKETVMRSTQWSLLAVLALLVYIMLASMFSLVSRDLSYGLPPTRTPRPSFTPTYPPQIVELQPTATATRVIPAAVSQTIAQAAAGAPVYAQDGRLTHVVQPGESLPVIAERYGVSSQAILHMNGLLDPNGVAWGQMLIIPGMNEALATWTPLAPPETPTPPPTNTRKPRPPTATPTDAPSPTPKTHQFTGEIVKWYANCGATGIHRPSQIRNMDGQPVNGLRVRLWYENTYEAYSLVAGIGGDYGPGEYDIAMRSGEAGNFKVAVWDWQTGPNEFTRVDSEVLDIKFDYDSQECQPGRSGHQSAVVNWYRHW